MRVLRKITVIFSLVLLFLLSFFAYASADGAQEEARGILVASKNFEELELGPLVNNVGGMIIYDPTNSGPRMGEYTVCSSDDGNHYVTQRYGAECYDTYPPYIEVAYGNSASVKSSAEGYYLQPAKYPLSRVKYYTLELDIMMPTGELTSGFDICPVFISYTNEENKSKTIYSSSPASAKINFSNGEDGSFVITSGRGQKASFTAKVGEWKHITYILEMDLSENLDSSSLLSSYNFTRSKLHVYVDGTLMFTVENSLASITGMDSLSSYHNRSAEYAALREFRINFPKTVRDDDNENQICAFDNVNLTVYDKSYTGSYTDVLAAHYNENYKKPDITSVATVDGKRYTTFDEAFKNLVEGSELVLRKDFTGEYTPSVAHTVTVGEHSFNYDVGSYYIDEIDENGNITFRPPTEDELVTLKWYGLNGEIIHTDENFVRGKTVTPPKAPCIRSNGWYDADYAWGYSNSTYAEDFVITEDTEFYPVLTEIRGNMSAAMYTVRPLGSIDVLLYLESETERPDGISALTLSIGDKKILPFDKVAELNDVGNYAVYDLGLFALGSLSADTKTVTVKFDVTLPMGEKRAVGTALDINVLDYVESVMSSPEYNTAHVTVSSLVNYIAAAAELINGELDDRTAYLVKAFGSLGTLQSGVNVPTGSSNPGTLNSYISSISFAPDALIPGYRLIFKEGTRVKNISYSVAGHYDACSDFYSNEASNYSISDSAISFFGGSEFIKEAIISDIPMFNATVPVNITLTLEDGTSVSGSYDIGKYYQSIKSGALKSDGVTTYTAEEAEAYKKFTEAFVAFASVAEKYAFPTGSTTVKDKAKHFIIKYRDYGAVGDGITDDFAAIKAAHSFANSLVDNGYINVTVVGEEDHVYYIGAGNITKEADAIIIRTDTDWTGARFIIDDSALVAGSTERTLHIFNVASEYVLRTVNSGADNAAGTALAEINGNGGIRAESTPTLALGLGYPAVLTVRGLYGTDIVTDTVSVDSKGRVLTPFTKDFTSVSSVEIYRSDNRKVTVSGGEFVTLLGTEKTSTSAYKRGILISRSGTTVTDLTHCISGVTKNSAKYSDFIEIANACNVEVSSSALCLDPIYLSTAENECEILVNGAVKVRITDIVKSELPEDDTED